MVRPALSEPDAAPRRLSAAAGLHRSLLRAAAASLWLGASLAAGWLLPTAAAHAQTRLLNATSAAAPLFEQIDAAFAADYKKQTGRDVRVETKAAPADTQVQAIRDGLAADVVALTDPAQLDALAAAGFAAPDWRAKFPQQAAPWGTTVLFAVRTGNPKRILDWADLARPGVRVLLPDPTTDATGRFAWLGAWGAVKKQGRTEAQTAQFAAQWLVNAKPLAASAQAARDAFRDKQQSAADVLVLLESDVPAWRQTTGGADVQLVRPRWSVLIEHPVAIVERTTRKKGTGELARAYLNFLFSPPAQSLAATAGLRPLAQTPPKSAPAGRLAKKPAAAAGQHSTLFTVADVFGSLSNAEQQQFGADGWLTRLQAKAAR